MSELIEKTPLPASLSAEIDFRRTCFLKNIDPKGKIGLEIGVFNRPTLVNANVKYLDFYSTEELKEFARANNDENIDFILDVDYVVKSDRYDEVIKDKFDYIIANHVIEHTANPVKWLKTLENMLNDGGYIFLTIPDKKYTYDKFIYDTNVSHLLCDYLEDVDDITNADISNSWFYHDRIHLSEGENDLKSRLNLDELKNVLKNKNPMQHSHIFQAETFVEKILNPILYTGILDLHLANFTDTRTPMLGEFIVILKKGFKPVKLNPELFFEPAKDSVIKGEKGTHKVVKFLGFKFKFKRR